MTSIITTYMAQCHDIRKLFGIGDIAVHFCEIIGQFDYQATNGEYPEDQYAFALEYLGLDDDPSYKHPWDNS